jgi:hypothetical protein
MSRRFVKDKLWLMVFQKTIHNPQFYCQEDLKFHALWTAFNAFLSSIGLSPRLWNLVSDQCQTKYRSFEIQKNKTVSGGL